MTLPSTPGSRTRPTQKREDASNQSSAILPLMAMLFLFGLLDPLTQNGQWGIFFTIIGIFVFITGLLALIFVKDGEIVSSQLSLKDTIQYKVSSSTVRWFRFNNGALVSVTPGCLGFW